jgi:hypothetical protein
MHKGYTPSSYHKDHGWSQSSVTARASVPYIWLHFCPNSRPVTQQRVGSGHLRQGVRRPPLMGFKAQWSVYMRSQLQIITHRQAWIWSFGARSALDCAGSSSRLPASHWSYILNLADTSIRKSRNTNFSATLFKYWFEGFESLFSRYNTIAAVLRLVQDKEQIWYIRHTGSESLTRCHRYILSVGEFLRPVVVVWIEWK